MLRLSQACVGVLNVITLYIQSMVITQFYFESFGRTRSCNFLWRQEVSVSKQHDPNNSCSAARLQSAHSGWKMSVVTLQLGQCGNQVGQELFDTICSDAQEEQRKTYSTACCERFFHQNKRGGNASRALCSRVKFILKCTLSEA